MAEAEGVQRGTKIVLHLKGDSYNFAKEERIKGWYQTERDLSNIGIR